MKRHNAITPLSRDHQKGLLLAQLLKMNAPEYRGLPKDVRGKINYAQETYHNDLKQHFKDEEEILFPVLKGKNATVDKMIEELLNEHLELRKKILSLNINDQITNQLNEIGELLNDHIRKEERILFEKAQEILSEKEFDFIQSKLEESRN